MRNQQKRRDISDVVFNPPYQQSDIGFHWLRIYIPLICFYSTIYQVKAALDPLRSVRREVFDIVVTSEL